MAEPESSVPTHPLEGMLQIANTDLDMTQPDGIPKPVERPRGPDGKFIKTEAVPVPQEPAGSSIPPAPSHPSYLVRNAQDLGYTDEDIAAMRTEDLGRAVYHANRLALQRSNEDARMRVIQDNQVRPLPPEVPKEPDVDLGVDLTQYDPDIVKVIKNAALYSQNKIKELEERLANNEKEVLQRSHKETVDLLDSAFDGLDNERLLGKGAASDLEKSNPAAIKRRIALLVELGIVVNGQLQPGKINRSSLARQLKAAEQELYGVPEAPAAAAKSAYETTTTPANGTNGTSRVTAQQWAEGAVAKPTQRSGAMEPKGDALAIRNLELKMRDNAPAQGDEEILGTLIRNKV